MKKLIFPLSLMSLCTFLLIGCDLAKPDRPPIDLGQEQIQIEEPPAPAPPLEPEKKENTTTLTKVDANTGARGQSLTSSTNNPVSIVSVPVKTMFRTQDRLMIMNLENAMKNYKILHEGKAPANQAEFDEKIIRANAIKLPTLRPNQKYIYDPTDGELKVETTNAP
jgi:hypothetical protein